MAAPERNAGLDTTRVCAILPVLVFHTPFASSCDLLGILGVELFFVLSGFLVAQMVVERFGALGEGAAVRAFLVNRWLRTLPLYLTFLAVQIGLTLAWPRLGAGTGVALPGFERLPDLLPFVTFTQNLTQGGRALHGDWFGVSWSLAVEEWFYVGLPIVVWSLRRRPLVEVALGLTALLMVVSVGGRLVRHLADPTLAFDDMFRRVLLLRLDAFCYGMLAYLWVARSPVCARRWRLPLAVAGLTLAVAATALCGHRTFGEAFFKVGYLSVLPASLALLLPLFHGLDVPSPSIRKALAFVSTRTYALYLVHVPLLALFMALVAPVTPATFLVLLGANLLAADLLYRHIERPFLALRPRYRPTSVAVEPSHTAFGRWRWVAT